jgi:Flp pilus assembly protein TadB
MPQAENSWAFAGLIVSAVLLIIAAWSVILIWYSFALLVWPLLLIVRVVGRHQRKEKADQLRHREMIEAVSNGKL